RIDRDPSLQVCPDFSSDDYAAIRTAAARDRNVSDADIARELTEAWTARNDAAKAAWAAQQEADHPQGGNPDNPPSLATDRKKPALAPFDPDLAAPDHLRPRPSAFAIHKLENFEYVELWYFTQDRCLDALSSSHSTGDHTFGLASEEDVLALRPIAAYKPSKAVVADDKLSWRQMEMGFSSMLTEMEATQWSEAHRTALANFYWNLTNHPYRTRPYGETALITYQARVRRHWHDSLKQGKGYNISGVNNNLLSSINDEVWDKHKRDAL
ncbi:hypothetical protein GLOTRDRAFT_25457, partial [Gloeophyllum trabeum ATCC 11539]